MLEVGCPDPALVLQRIESTRSWAASSATVSRSICGTDAALVVVVIPLLFLVGYGRRHAAANEALYVGTVDGLPLEQQLGEPVQRLPMIDQ